MTQSAPFHFYMLFGKWATSKLSTDNRNFRHSFHFGCMFSKKRGLSFISLKVKRLKHVTYSGND